MKYGLRIVLLFRLCLSVFLIFTLLNSEYSNIYAKSSSNLKGPYSRSKFIRKSCFHRTEISHSMVFIGSNDILGLEKDEGTVNRIVNGTMLSEPLLKVPVTIDGERGMIGIAVSKHKDRYIFILLYYTESGGGKTGDDFKEGIPPLGNHLYRYELVDNILINPKLLLNLPATLVHPPNII